MVAIRGFSMGATMAVWAAAIGVLSVSAHAQGSAAAPEARVIVKFKASAGGRPAALSASSATTGPQRAATLGARAGFALRDGRAIDDQTQVVFASGITSAQLAQRLSADGDVDFAVVDQRRYARGAPNDPYYAGGQTTITPAVGQWYLRAPTTSVVAAINAESAWDRSTGAGVVVAILDTGVRRDHPDLVAKLLPGYDFVSDVQTANDGDGRDSDPSDPGDWVSSADVAGGGTFFGCDVESSSWHGTQTAGLVGAATNNGIGMAGVGGDVMVLPLRVLGKCGGYDSDIIAAMRWAAGLSVPGVPANTRVAKVLNLSLGSPGACGSAYAAAITEVNATGASVVVSAGNDGLAVNSPANCAGVIAVAGVRHSGTKVGYSSLGPEVALSAPAGNCVNLNGTCLYPLLTATNSGSTAPASNVYSNGTNISVGTSFAAPLVAGTAALMYAAQPTLTHTDVLDHLRASARAFPTSGADAGVGTCQAPGSTAQDTECYCTTGTCGAGLLDASAALTRVRPTAPPITPVIAYNASSVAIGSPLTLDASGSTVPAGTARVYAWQVVSGPATITSADNAETVNLQPSAAGTVVLRVSVNGVSRDARIVVGTPPPATPPLISGEGGGGGGGALGPLWLLGLCVAVVSLHRQRTRGVRV